jgi:D-aminopeptidase
MAANTVTSTTGTESGTDPTFIVAYKTIQSQGVILYVKYTQGTEANITLTFDVLNTSLHASDKYRHVSLNGTDLTAYTMEIAISGNYRIPLPVITGETTIYANITFSTANQGGAVVANFIES